MEAVSVGDGGDITSMFVPGECCHVSQDAGGLTYEGDVISLNNSIGNLHLERCGREEILYQCT